MKYENRALDHRIAVTGLTQGQFAKAAKLNWGTIYNALKGKRISRRSAHKIAKALGCTPPDVGLFY